MNCFSNHFLFLFVLITLYHSGKKIENFDARYFDARDQSVAADSNNLAFHNFYTSTVVSSTQWNSLVRTAKSVAFDAEEPLSDRAQERLKANFEK